MKEIILHNPQIDEPLPINWYTSELDSDKAIVFIGGYGDDRNYYDAILKRLVTQFPVKHILSFSFRGLETDKGYSLNQQVRDLQEVMKQIVDKLHIKKVQIVLTSDGAYSAYFLLSNSVYGKYIIDVLMLDPADYYIEQGDDREINLIWSGDAKYKPDKPLVSDLLKKIRSDVNIHIVHFILRNYNKGGYISKDSKERGLDQKEGFPRLNTQMVRAIYEKIPTKNRGEYTEDPMLPHAFERDGNIEKNRKRIVELIVKYIR